MKHTKLRTVNLLALILIFTLVFGGCDMVSEGKADDSKITASSEEQEHQNEGSYERVIALSKSNAELWILAGGKLVGTSDDALDISGLNEDVTSLGDMDHVSLEAVVALNPDMLILFSSVPAQKALGEAAEAVGINVYYTNIDGYGDYDKVMGEFTGMTGNAGAYGKYVSDVRKEIEETKKKVSVSEEKKTYLLLHVSATKSKAEKNDYFASEIFNDLGLKNIASDSSAFDELSLEAIISADPDYIFVVPRGDEKKALSAFTELFESQPVWETLSAVKEKRYYLLSKDLFGTKPNALWGEAYSTAYGLLYGTD